MCQKFFQAKAIEHSTFKQQEEGKNMYGVFSTIFPILYNMIKNIIC